MGSPSITRAIRMSIISFSSHSFGPAFAELLGEERLNPLGPGKPNAAAQPKLEVLSVERAFPGNKVAELAMAQCCLAGIWLYHNYLDESHKISQEIETPSGSFWHGILHRREPDAANSKYWWRRVGNHPVLDMLRQCAPTVGGKFTSPFDFVEHCERVRDSGSAEEETAQRVQLLEWQLLFAYCYRSVVPC